MKEKLRGMLKEKRFIHSVGVSETAVKLATRYGVDTEKARIAGLIHDCAKNIPYDEAVMMCERLGVELDDVERANPALIHAPLGRKVAEIEFGVTDEEILRAIELHTTGGADMTVLDKIIYLADMIEPSREYDGVEEIRQLCRENLDKAMLYALEQSIIFNLEKGVLLHTGTVKARNELIINIKKSL